MLSKVCFADNILHPGERFLGLSMYQDRKLHTVHRGNIPSTVLGPVISPDYKLYSYEQCSIEQCSIEQW